MPRLIRLSVAILSAAALSACASAMDPHRITVLEREGSTSGQRTAPRQYGNSGPMTIRMDGKVYQGDWTFVRGGQAGLLSAWGTGGSAFGVSSMQNTQGVGNALLTSANGGSLRCQFRYSTSTGTGIGACKDGDGELYDMQIVTP